MVKLTKRNYLERDVSWMYFNHRILEEAMREDIPVLERMSFLGIYSSNLDEFFRVRIANLVRIASIESPEGKEFKLEVERAKEQLKVINKLNADYSLEYSNAVDSVTNALAKQGVNIISERDIDEAQREFIHDLYRKKILGRISPIWFENIGHFEKDADDRIYMIVKMSKENSKPYKYALFNLPVEEIGRWVSVPSKADSKAIMYLDDVIRVCLPLIFPSLALDTFEAWTFKFTRDAEMEIDNDLREGFLQKIQKGVKSRKVGQPLRLVYDKSMPEGVFRRIKSKLVGNSKLDTAVAGGRYQNHKDLMSFPDCGIKSLRYPQWPSVISDELKNRESLIKAIREKDRFIHVPYHSFDSYISLLNEAAIDTKVKSIKTTLYRLAKDSKVIRALICAAQNGKKVTVIIELLARFDEAPNISWAKTMQDAGINVIFGVEGLKVHSKITHIGLASGQDIAVISTGNFHEGNASRYTDILLMTANMNVVHDVERVFKFIEKPYSLVKFKELLVSPNDMKKKLLALIDNEIKNHLSGKPAWIKVKVNHITDKDMVSKVYEATKAGVKIGALVRGNCSLIENEDCEGNLKVVGIIDRYLEHSRILIFANGGEPLYFLGSADWMPRNLDCRVEVVTPVYDRDIQQELQRIVDFGLKDNTHGRLVIGSKDELAEFRSQEELYKYYADENKQQ
ncbi:MAG: RNA degradosome polyphosphate kinase [Paludibacteraceae bacterium]|nr:RNA degradosome polyphosphate kinase [Paludibacteraceae bacterium]